MATTINDNTPILVGVGQVAETDLSDSSRLSSAYDLAATAARRAIDNADGIKPLDAQIDALVCIRLFEDSTRKIAIVSNPLGASNNVPGSIAKRLQISPRELVYAAVGGQTPQRLINEFSEKIFHGENQCVLITGAEAIATIKHAVRNNIALDWNESVDGDYEDRWLRNNADNMVSEYEMAHGLFLPVQAYPLFENAHRHNMGLNVQEHRKNMAELFAPFTQVAAKNPYAQFRETLSEDFLATPSDENYLLSEPYTKWFVAQDAVNQGAAVLLTSVGLARESGIPEAQWVYLHGYADADDLNVVQRDDLSVSRAQALVCEQSFANAETDIQAIEHLDIYSCFPVAVTSACAALNIDPESRPLTLTGGLPFFGGPGNNYSMHAIAEVVQKARANRGSWGMVIANGGYLSKHSAGVYSTTPKQAWQPFENRALRNAMQKAPSVDVAERMDGIANIETYVAFYKRGKPALGYVFARTETNSRIIAKVDESDQGTLAQLFESEPIGRKISVKHAGGLNTFVFE